MAEILSSRLGWQEGATEAFRWISVLECTLRPAVVRGVSAVFFRKSHSCQRKKDEVAFLPSSLNAIDTSTTRMVILSFVPWAWISLPSSLEEICSCHVSACILQCVLEEMGDTASPRCGVFLS